MCVWARTRGMEFNVLKCIIMHISHNNPNYNLNWKGPLSAPLKQRDLGIAVDKTLKPSKPCKKASARAQVVLSQILKFSHYRDRNHYLSLYKTFVRPHLEFATTAWAGLDVETLEKVQQKAVKKLSGIKVKPIKKDAKKLD